MKTWEPMNLELRGKNYNVYSYDYCFDFADKIYYSKGDTQLLETLLKVELTYPMNEHLAGDIAKEFRITDNALTNQIEQMLVPHISEIEQAKVSSLSFIDDSNIINTWINYMKPNEFNPVHDHGGIYSFVWYLDIPEEIRQEYKNSNGNTLSRGCIQFNSSMKANSRMKFNPKTNDLLIFASRHQHQVYPFYSNNTRISLAGNIYGVNYE